MRTRSNKSALFCLILGLLPVTSAPIMLRRFNVPDYLPGLFTGLGLALECIAIIKLQRARQCAAWFKVVNKD